MTNKEFNGIFRDFAMNNFTLKKNYQINSLIVSAAKVPDLQMRFTIFLESLKQFKLTISFTTDQEKFTFKFNAAWQIK